MDETTPVTTNEVTDAGQTAPPATPAEPGMNQLLARLDSIEKLLQDQQKFNEKTARSRRTTTFLMVCLALILAGGMFWLNLTLSTSTKELPVLIESTTQAARQLRVTLEEISAIDFKTLNSTIGEIETSLGAIDFEALNKSIVDLQQVVEKMRKFMDIFP